jgi:hypothetical protein
VHGGLAEQKVLGQAGVLEIQEVVSLSGNSAGANQSGTKAQTGDLLSLDTASPTVVSQDPFAVTSPASPGDACLLQCSQIHTGAFVNAHHDQRCRICREFWFLSSASLFQQKVERCNSAWRKRSEKEVKEMPVSVSMYVTGCMCSVHAFGAQMMLCRGYPAVDLFGTWDWESTLSLVVTVRS